MLKIWSFEYMMAREGGGGLGWGGGGERGSRAIWFRLLVT